MASLRPPSFSPGFQSLAWALVLGTYVFVGLVAIGMDRGSAFLFGVIAAALIFFYVRLYGEDPLRRS